MTKTALSVLLGLGATMVSAAALAADAPVKKADRKVAQEKAIRWLTDYSDAMQQAKLANKMLLVLFDNEGSGSAASRQIEARLNNDPKLQAKLDRFVLVRVPTNTQITSSGKKVTVLKHAAFSELRAGPGLAIIDFAHKGTNHYGHVVTAIRFTPGKYYSFRPEHFNVLLDLPPGTLTQRTMIFAVRIHPEKPGSAWGTKDPVLSEEAASHSRHQAQIGVQGHHHWDTRFQRILGRLLGRRSGNSAPVEVVAESWPNQDLVDSCVDCVDSWRQSPGHWNAVQNRQSSYGYDIRRGGNGIWYATGIFSR